MAGLLRPRGAPYLDGEVDIVSLKGEPGLLRPGMRGDEGQLPPLGALSLLLVLRAIGLSSISNTDCNQLETGL